MLELLGDILTAALPALGLVAMLLLVVAVWALAAAVAVPRSRAIGGRARDHAVLLSTLPASSHPDAAGHARPRAPGVLSPVA
jgi:hypothetical protein